MNSSACEIWGSIVTHTDEIYLVGEKLKPVFDTIMPALIQEAGMSSDALKMAPLKDPVRVYEKAISDYGDRFNDDVIPQACVVDVLRCLCLAEDGVGISRVFSLILQDGGFRIEIDQGCFTELRIIRCKNKFAPAALGPTRFRNALLNLELTYGGEAMSVPSCSHHTTRLDF